MFGDIGGLLEVLLIVSSLILAPWTEFKYTSKLIQKSYLVRTKDADLFRATNSQKHLRKLDLIASSNSQDTSDIRLAKFSFCDEQKLFCRQYCCKCFCGKNKDKRQKWYEMGLERVEKELDLVKLLRR